MAAQPYGSPDAAHDLRADQRTLLRAVATLLPGSAQQAPSPISLVAGNRVALLHNPDRTGLGMRIALFELLREAGVRVEPVCPPPQFGKIRRHLTRTNLVIAASSNPAIHAAARRCGGRWAAPVLTATDARPHDAPLRLAMRTAPTLCVKQPAMAPDFATRAVRIHGPISWSHRPGPPEHHCTGLAIAPEAESAIVTSEYDSDSPRTSRIPDAVFMRLAGHTPVDIDGQTHHFPPGRTMIVRSSLPLYEIQVHPAPTPVAG